MQLIERMVYVLFFFTYNKHSINLKYVFFWETSRLMSNKCKFELENVITAEQTA